MKKTILLFLFIFPMTKSSFAEDKAAAKTPANPLAPTVSATEILPGSATICEADIFYSWKLKPPVKKEKEKTSEPAVTITPTKVLFQTIGEEGANETDIKNKLNAKITLAQKQALEDCQSLHQDQGLCLTKKIKSQQDLLGKLDFATKNTIIAAATSDCQNEQGICEKVEVSEIRCYLNKTEKLKVEQPIAEKGSEKSSPEAAKKK